MIPRVSILKYGSMLKDNSGRILDARSSVALVSAEEHRIIVDTGLKGEEKEILAGLSQIGLKPENIDVVINTHSHPDHTGNNYLFSEAELLSPKEGDLIAPGVRVIETPGHSLDSISVIVESRDTVALVGDALPTFSNYLKMVPPAHHVDRVLACSSMSRILKIADVVVPGHDRPFVLSKRAYTIL